jgi:alkanesulfonate monooxygenase SsuD/methylene tetrahydromethanopterin reductase-like flavin-dependent oxidoreductase (luciferase family)
MRFGLCYVPDYDERRDGDYATWSAPLVEQWSAADALGFDTVWLAEHLYPGYGFSPAPRLAQSIAEHTSRLRVGIAVAPLARHHPMLDASHWAAADVAARGRLSLGIGRAVFSDDSDSQDPTRARYEEALLMMRRLWSEPLVTHVSNYWLLHRMTLRPQPLQKPAPPVYVACATSAEAYVWAGASGCHLIVSPYLLESPDAQRRYLDLYREALAHAGFDPSRFEVLANYHLFVVENEYDLGAADRDSIRYLRFLARATSLERNGVDPRDETMRRLNALLRKQAIVGTPERCVEQMTETAVANGLTGWILQIDHRGTPHEQVLSQLHLIAGTVMRGLAGEPPHRAEPSPDEPPDDARNPRPTRSIEGT